MKTTKKQDEDDQKIRQRRPKNKMKTTKKQDEDDQKIRQRRPKNKMKTTKNQPLPKVLLSSQSSSFQSDENPLLQLSFTPPPPAPFALCHT